MPRKPPTPDPKNLWKPGQSGNPSGRPKKLLTRDHVEHHFSTMAALSTSELEILCKDPKEPALRVMIARVIIEAIKAGDYSRLNFLLDRSIGKVKDVAEITNINHDDTIKQAPRESLMALLSDYRGPKEGTNG